MTPCSLLRPQAQVRVARQALPVDFFIPAAGRALQGAPPHAGAPCCPFGQAAGALRLKIGLTCYLFWGVCAIKPQAETTTSCCLLSGALMCSVCPSSRFTLRPTASFPPVASSADLLRCRRKSVKHGEDILESEENWHQEASSRGEGGVTLPAQVANHAWERLQRHGN